MNAFHKYNSDNMAYLAFGLDVKEHYDALVVAPSYSPYKLKMDSYCKVTTLKEGAIYCWVSCGKGWFENSMDKNVIIGF